MNTLPPASQETECWLATVETVYITISSPMASKGVQSIIHTTSMEPTAFPTSSSVVPLSMSVLESFGYIISEPVSSTTGHSALSVVTEPSMISEVNTSGNPSPKTSAHIMNMPGYTPTLLPTAPSSTRPESIPSSLLAFTYPSTTTFFIPECSFICIWSSQQHE